MKNMSLRQIAAAVRGRYEGPEAALSTEVSAVVTDSRQAAEGCLFAAIRGARVDGHRFAAQVAGMGASCVLSEQTAAENAQLCGDPRAAAVPTIVVPSVLQALKDLAEWYRAQFTIPVIGVIGSVGKTSTKEMLAAVLSQKYRVLKTEGNFNNELGVPMTLFRLREGDEIAVVEMGINHFGEMHRLAKMVRPDTVVFTNIGTAHLEFLGSRDGILKAKSEVFDFFAPTGHILLNGDDDKLATIREKCGVTPMRFGLTGPENSYTATDMVPVGMEGTRCRIHTPRGSFAAMVPSPGAHMVVNALAACAAGQLYGLTNDEIARGIAGYAALKGRFHVSRTQHLTIIDDCYNANPASMRASLTSLARSAGRRVAILGDMGELGVQAVPLHEEVGAFAASCGVDALYCVGEHSRHMATAAQAEDIKRRARAADGADGAAEAAMQVRWFADVAALVAALPDLVKMGDTVLVKASHFLHFDEVVRALEQI